MVCRRVVRNRKIFVHKILVTDKNTKISCFTVARGVDTSQSSVVLTSKNKELVFFPVVHCFINRQLWASAVLRYIHRY